ncbi:MAG: glycosyltransferase family A protein [Candidatus Krumholzibacteria bacterium]
MNFPQDTASDTTSHKPKASVIIPCYNGERFIAEAIDSVLDQSFSDLEIIVVDDGSTDGSKAVVERYVGSERVTRIDHDENRGIAAARNTGVRAAQAEFIAFLDQDDLWYPQKLQKQLRVFEEDRTAEIGLVFSAHKISFMGKPPRTPRGTHVPTVVNKASREAIFKALFLHNFIPMSSVVIRRQCFDTLGLLDESIRSGADDYEFCTRLVLKYRICHVDEPLMLRRVHDSNFTDDEKLSPAGIEINRRLLDKHPELAPLRVRRESELLFKLGRALHGKGERKRAKQAYRDAMKVRPGYMKALLALALCNLGRVGDSVLRGWKRFRVG